MSRYTFQEIVVHAKRSGKCAVCGKGWRRQKRFSHTVNPLNRNADGSQKSRDEVYQDVKAEAAAWQPTNCPAHQTEAAEPPKE